jgi:hypothetical protein
MSIQNARSVIFFDSRRHTQILYKENRKMLYGAQKNKGKNKYFTAFSANITQLNFYQLLTVNI